MRRNLDKGIVNEYALNSEGSLMHYKGRLINYLFQLFLKLYGRPEENSSYFSNVQPYTINVLLMHLLNNVINMYTHISLQYKYYITVSKVGV